MSPRMPLFCLLLITLCGPAFTDDDDDTQPAAAPGNTARPALTRGQQQAVGITVIHPVKGHAAAAIDGYGQVLDVASLIGDAGHLASARAVERAASTEAERLSVLYKNGADASLRALEAAQAAQIEAQTQARIAASAFELQWGPIARFSDTQRTALIEALSSGHTALLRADLPGRLRLASVPQTATVIVDGAPVDARVLGPLPRSAAESQSVGLLLQIDHAPSGLGAGARIHVSLHGAASDGVIVPNSALLYGDQGIYVYRQLVQNDATGSAKAQYAPVLVKLLQSSGDAWLVQGVDDDDLIVANGAGVLWSLQGLGTFSAEEDSD